MRGAGTHPLNGDRPFRSGKARPEAGAESVEACKNFYVAGDGGTGAGAGTFVLILNDKASADFKDDCNSCGCNYIVHDEIVAR